ncbi:hypothetical protein SUGI_0299500 [Cryptomeria japonica]|nr:hypothetical protein SUGI_0299500 [Cryptomeria japonica]
MSSIIPLENGQKKQNIKLRKNNIMPTIALLQAHFHKRRNGRGKTEEVIAKEREMQSRGGAYGQTREAEERRP